MDLRTLRVALQCAKMVKRMESWDFLSMTPEQLTVCENLIERMKPHLLNWALKPVENRVMAAKSYVNHKENYT